MAGDQMRRVGSTSDGEDHIEGGGQHSDVAAGLGVE